MVIQATDWRIAQCPPNTKVSVRTASQLSSLEGTANRLGSERHASTRKCRQITLAPAEVVWLCLPSDCNWNENSSPSLQNQRWLVCWPFCCCYPPRWP